MSKYSNSSLLMQDERVSDEQLVEETKILQFGRSIARMNRRNFVTSLGIAAAAAGTLGVAGCSNDGVITPVITPPSVVDVLNFALNLEYLEANFYSYIVTGNSLSTTDLGGSPSITGGAKYSFTNVAIQNIATDLYQDEQAHVEFLRATISAVGGTPVACPSLNLGAMGSITSDAGFLGLARQLEATGVSAYAGGAQYLVSSTTAVTYAAQILHVEAQHEGNIRQVLIQLGATSGAVDGIDAAVTATSPQIFNTNPATGLYSVRTTSQVLQIVYGAAGQTGIASGGFYPAGMNGNIRIS